MRRIFLMLVLCLVGRPATSQTSVALREMWDRPYGGADVTAKHVSGLWSFDAADSSADDSAHQHPGKLEGAEIAADGRFGKCLRSFPGWPVEDKPHRLLVPHQASLNSAGALSLELWVNPDPAFQGYPEAFLLDKKYVAHTDYQLIVGREGQHGRRRLQAHLGFGSRSESWRSELLVLDVGTWYHIAFVYDGQGTGRFFVNGRLAGEETMEGLGPVTAGGHPLSIGDRIGSYYHGFPGRLDQVRITGSALEFRRARISQVSDRSVFRRMEQDVALQFAVTNLQRSRLANAELRWRLDTTTGPPTRISPLAPGASQVVSYPLDTRLRPDQYALQAAMTLESETSSPIRDQFPIQIVPRQTPDAYPIVMWGAGPTDSKRLTEIGFTHALGIGVDYARIWAEGRPAQALDDKRLAATRRALDHALSDGLSFAASLSPGGYLRSNEDLLRVDRAGQKNVAQPDICGLFPKIGDFCFNVGVSTAQAYGDMPAFQAALLHTEVRDAAQPCFHPHDLAAFREAAGIEVPPQADRRWGVDYKGLPDFPPDRVIADHDPLYRYYRWYWKHGDGWNHLNSQLQRGLESMQRSDFWTWHDPAVRVASVYGAGGNVDYLSQWTYSYPDPIRIALATDELLAMARGSDTPQRVMKMTQIIWYRSQTAPERETADQGPEFVARWEREQPDAPFITIAPMHLREAFWTKIARPIRGIMYHGWQSLAPVESTSSYRFTHPQTQHELARLIRTVVKPLGPMLLGTDQVNNDVAFHESFASQMFAGRGTYGWGGKWLGDAYLVAMWAGLQPDVVFDETIAERGLDRYKLLIMADCDVLTESVVQRIRAFQQRGGLIVGDDHTCPAIQPDILLQPYSRTGHADKDKAELLLLARQLRQRLDGRYQQFVSSSNCEVIPYVRSHGSARYLFLVNDHREFGDYVGHHGRVMENGLPSSTTIELPRSSGFVYDLVHHRPIKANTIKTDTQESTLRWDMDLGPCEGAVLMITPQAIDRLRLASATQAVCGDKVELTIDVEDASGHRLNAIIPLELAIEDATGRLAECSGYWAARDGHLVVELDVAHNETPGVWTIRATELASGISTQHFLRVMGIKQRDRVGPMDDDAANPVQPKG